MHPLCLALVHVFLSSVATALPVCEATTSHDPLAVVVDCPSCTTVMYQA